MKLVCYIQCGLGDFYDLLCMLPDFIKKRNIKKEDIKFYVDSVYFVQNINKPKELVIKLMELITKNWEVIPADIGSWQNLFYDDRKDFPTGPVYEKIKNTFLFYRRPQTKDFFKKRLDKDTIFLHAIMGANFTYEWKDGVNVPLKGTYERRPLRFQLPKYHTTKVELDAMFGKNTALVQVRRKGKCITDGFFNEILTHLQSKGFNPIYVNLDGGKITCGTNVTGSSPESLMYILEHIKYAVITSSIFSFHRVHFDKPTIITIPERLIGIKYVYQKEYVENPKYLFLNSDWKEENVLPRIKERIDTWQN